MNKIMILIIGIVLVAGGAWFVLGSKKPASVQVGSSSSATEKTYSLADVAKHATEADCWAAIHDNVYDLTPAISRHPGGKAILEGCGKDATTLFETRPMGSKTPHSDRARETLAKFRIGALAK